MSTPRKVSNKPSQRRKKFISKLENSSVVEAGYEEEIESPEPLNQSLLSECPLENNENSQQDNSVLNSEDQEEEQKQS